MDSLKLVSSCLNCLLCLYPEGRSQLPSLDLERLQGSNVPLLIDHPEVGLDDCPKMYDSVQKKVPSNDIIPRSNVHGLVERR
jgi:hypothetical protein